MVAVDAVVEAGPVPITFANSSNLTDDIIVTIVEGESRRRVKVAMVDGAASMSPTFPPGSYAFDSGQVILTGQTEIEVVERWT